MTTSRGSTTAAAGEHTTTNGDPAKISSPATDPPTELGAIFTKRWVAELVLDLAGYIESEPLYEGVVVEPSCGHGAFLEVVVERLLSSCRRDGVDLESTRATIVALDLDATAITAARKRVVALLRANDVSDDLSRSLASTWIRKGDFLKRASALPKARWVVGNPPYVRIEGISKTDIADYRSRWSTMSGRADVYVGFFEAGLSLLEPDGRLGFICADRWMRNAYGASLRQLVEEEFAVETCLVMHAVDAFEDRVAAYPAITVLRRREQGDALVVEAEGTFDAAAAARLVKMRTRGSAPIGVDDDFRASWLPTWPRSGGSWPAGVPERLQLIAELESTLPALEETGAKVSVGTATGADEVYVVNDATLVEKGFAFPTLAAKETSLGGIDWRERYIVSPWTRDGLVDLDTQPLLGAYLKRHRKRLEERHIVRKNSERWWRTIDRIDPDIAGTPKLLIPDLKDRIHPVLDQGRFVPLHSLYYITSDRWDLSVLGGLLLSDQANMFVEAYSVRMASGYLRVSAQYLRRVRVPMPESIPKATAARLRAAFWSRDVQAATKAAAPLYVVD